MVPEGRVLLGVEHLEQRGRRVAPVVVADLVDLVHDKDRVGRAGLVDALALSKGPNWKALLSAESVLSAVNHTMVDSQQLLENGDEVAFFPPVTGG